MVADGTELRSGGYGRGSAELRRAEADVEGDFEVLLERL